ncbi:MAG: hypothetical protein FJ134_06860 [Deltaproteobacteria bacterium]|nr:hypothetical protein [Deltaproteobacteria bacterium]
MLLGIWGEIPAAWGRNPGVEVRRVGLSRVGDTTMLTVVLDRPAEARLSTRTSMGKPQLVVEFLQARGARLPSRLEGDDLLVERALTEVAPEGVRIVLELFPDRPYTFWKKIQKGPAGQSLWVLGLNPDPSAPRMERPRPPEPLEPPGGVTESEPGLAPPAPPPEDYRLKESERVQGSPGSFAELKSLMPKAATLLEGLERDGWTISEFHSYDRPGQRFSRDFILTHRQYPELAVKIVYLPANMPNTPNINILSLTTDRLGGETADKYRQMRKMSFSQIKKEHEDIGDFFDDALKPLRVKLREQTKAVALRDARVFQNFLSRAAHSPQVAEKVMNHIREKVNQRFEGVQYTVMEDPLVLLNLVDFLYVRVYFLETR